MTEKRAQHNGEYTVRNTTMVQQHHGCNARNTTMNTTRGNANRNDENTGARVASLKKEKHNTFNTNMVNMTNSQSQESLAFTSARATHPGR